MDTQKLIHLIEAILFVSAKPLKISFLAKHLQIERTGVEQAIQQLFELKKDSGVVVLHTSDNVQLATEPTLADEITAYLNADLKEKLTDAQLEVLAIIAYRGNISKAEIEAIRGVNSQYALRQLLMRGLVEKKPSPTDQRSLNYEVTTEFLQHFGISNIVELPDYEGISHSVKLPEKAVLENTPQDPTTESSQQTITVETTPAS